ncbi:dynamin family protein [bacterium]|nr:dynamin family protein [bacterium]
MILKEQYLKNLNNFLEILHEQKSADHFVKKAENLQKRVEDFMIKVPLIGRFSAGKSRLLNTYLSQNLLEWSDSPTTAIATELKYSSNERIVIHYSKEDSIEKELTDLKSIEQDVDKIEYIEIYLNNPKLKELEEIVLVDMPGIDSNNFQHTKAVSNYASNGNYFIVVASPLDAFNDRLIAFISEFVNYDYESFSFILTRKKSSHDIEEIQNKLSILLSEKFNAEIFVGTTEASKKFGYDIDDFEKSIAEIKSQKEAIFMANFKFEFIDLLDNTITFISTKLKGSNLSAEQLEIAIKDIEEAIEIERREFEKKLSKIENDLTELAVSNIMNQISSVVRSNFSQLVKALNSGSIENHLENIVRPITLNGFKQAINEAEQILAKKLGEVRERIDIKTESLLSINSLSKTNTELKDSQIIATKIIANKLAKPLVGKTVSKVASMATRAGFATAGATIGSFVPVIGTLVGAIVGELVSELFLGSMNKKNIEEQIKNEVIPQAIENISETVKKQAIDIYAQVKETYTAVFNDLEKEKLQNIIELKKEKEKSEVEFAGNKLKWESSLTQIRAINEEIHG